MFSWRVIKDWAGYHLAISFQDTDESTARKRLKERCMHVVFRHKKKESKTIPQQGTKSLLVQITY